MLLAIIVVILCSQLQWTCGNFATRLFLSITANQSNVNLAIAPMAIHESLILLYLGSDGEGSRELKRQLKLKGEHKEEIADYCKDIPLSVRSMEVTLQTAFKLFVDKMFPLKPTFKSVAQRYMHSNIDTINIVRSHLTDFELKSAMDHQFTEIIDRSDIISDTRSILVQAFYFEGTFEKPFKQLMRKRMFFVQPKETIFVVTYIKVDKLPYADLNHIKCYAIEIPYKDSSLSLTILLPYKGTTLRALETKLANTDLRSLTEDFEETNVHVEIPHFSISYSSGLIPALKRMGINTIFDRPYFDSLTDTPFFKVSKIKHVGHLVFDCGMDECVETTIASVTGNDNSRVKFLANRPFFFAIRDERRVYIMGRVVNPKIHTTRFHS